MNRVMGRTQRQGPQFLTLDPALHQIADKLAANWPRVPVPPVDLIASLTSQNNLPLSGNLFLPRETRASVRPKRPLKRGGQH